MKPTPEFQQQYEDVVTAMRTLLQNVWMHLTCLRDFLRNIFKYNAYVVVFYSLL